MKKKAEPKSRPFCLNITVNVFPFCDVHGGTLYNEGKDQQTICNQLLSDAETGKNGAKHFVRGYLSSDRS